MYEDEGINYNYEDGKFSKIEFEYNESTKTLTINRQEGEFPGMLKEHIFSIIAVSESNPIGYNPDAEGKKITYNGEKVKVKLK